MLTCIVRPSAAPLTVPKAAEVSCVFGLFQRWKLKGFTASRLSSAFKRSLIENSRPMVRDSCLFQNPRTQLRLVPRLPKLNPVLVVNAAEFRYLLVGVKSRGLVTRYGETPGTAF